MRRFAMVILGLVVMGGIQAQAQGAKASTDGDNSSQANLFRAIKAQDAALFDAFNTCDLKTLGSMVTDDLEFYHDVTGLAIGRTVFVESIKNNICGKVRRQLVESSLEVHPLKGYGAVEIGVHRFSHPGMGDHDVLGEARFVQLWRLQDGVWRLSRVISFEHGTAH